MSQPAKAPVRKAEPKILNFIGGEFVAAQSGKTFANRSPVDVASRLRDMWA